jgi:NEDD4-binding protein 2
MKLVLMRGVTGCGKSTRARELLEQNPQAVILSTDDLFIVEGQYVFDPDRLADNHKQNVERCRLEMLRRRELIIIDNTNVQAWEMKPYRLLALEHDYETVIEEIEPPPLDELLRRHEKRTDKQVPRNVLERMLERWRPGIRVEEIK